MNVVMGYYNVIDLFVYDMLVCEYVVCDYWYVVLLIDIWFNCLYVFGGSLEGFKMMFLIDEVIV